MPNRSPARSHRALDALFLDLRHALRSLLRDRSFMLTAIGMLTLAIALNVAAFTLMSTMLFRGYPLVERNDRLVYIQERGAPGCCVAYGSFLDWRQQATSFDDMAFVDGRTLTIGDESGGRVRLSALATSTELFRLLGVRPLHGRDFVADDAATGAEPVAILSHGFWQRRFGGSTDVIGQTLATDGTSFTVIGVMPEGFSFPEHHDLWLPLPGTLTPTDRAPSGFLVVARLADGATLQSARAELATISRRLADAYPATNRGVTPEVRPHSQFFFGDGAKILYGSMWAATWFVLLIACANLANLSIARTLGRAHEISTRLALGAGYLRMSRQMLMENLLIGTFAGGCGWWLAKWSVATYAAATASVHYVLAFSMSPSILAYLGAVAFATGVLLTLVPVANLKRIDLSASLKGGGRGTAAAFSSKQAALIVGQTMFAVVLLSGSGVLMRSFMKFETAPLGIDPRNVLAASIELPAQRFVDMQARVAFMSTLEARLDALPGVELVATTGFRPLAGAMTRAFEVEGRAPDGNEAEVAPPTVSALLTGPGYFRTVGAAVLAGRDFADTDVALSPPVAIVNQRFAEANWPNESALGKRIRLSSGDGSGDWLTVVGVASNIMQGDPTRQTFPPLVYLSHRQQPTILIWTLVKTVVPPATIAAAARREIQSLDSDLYITDVSPLEEIIAFDAELMDVEHQHLGRNAVLFPIFAGSALLLAAIGLYAVVAHAVARRTREIGVRIAVGATTAHIWRWVLREGMGPVAIGLVVGLGVSLGMNRMLQSQLIGVAFYDPVTMVAAPVVLVIVALLACRIPAGRAMRVDPAAALRRDRASAAGLRRGRAHGSSVSGRPPSRACVGEPARYWRRLVRSRAPRRSWTPGVSCALRRRGSRATAPPSPAVSAVSPSPASSSSSWSATSHREISRKISSNCLFPMPIVLDCSAPR